MLHEISYVWINYFWSSDKGNGPEAIQQTVIYAALAVTFIPAVRHFFTNHFESVKRLAEKHHKEKMDQAQQHHEATLAQAANHHEALKQHIRDILDK